CFDAHNRKTRGAGHDRGCPGSRAPPKRGWQHVQTPPSMSQSDGSRRHSRRNLLSGEYWRSQHIEAPRSRQCHHSIGTGAKVLSEMPGQVESGKCILCEQGRVVEESREINFRQDTDKGEVSCRIAVQFNFCPQCGFEYWDDQAEAVVDEAVRRAYEKLELSHVWAPLAPADKSFEMTGSAGMPDLFDCTGIIPGG